MAQFGNKIDPSSRSDFNYLKLLFLFSIFIICYLCTFALAEASIIDNSDSGFTTVGTWGNSTYSPGYYGSDYQYAPPGNGSMTATWTFDIVNPGLYNVFAQWTSHSNRASNAPYTIYNNGQAVSPAILVDQRVNGGQFNQLGGSYSLAAGTLEVVLSDNASGYVIADAVQILPYSGTTHTITATAGANGSISPSGDVTVGDGSDETFTITPDAGYYVLDVSVDNVSVGAMTSYTFTNVTSDHTIDASFAMVTSNNIVDNLDASFTTVGTWGSSTYSPGYYGSNYEWAPPGDGSMTATWTFDIASSGMYNVFAQWTTNSNRASNAPYTIYNNGQAVGPAISVDQRVNGGQFNQLGGPYSLAAGTLEVVLSDNASGYVIADAVQVVPFAGTTHTITATAEANGSISPSGAVTVGDGSNETFTITPNAGYHVLDVLVDNVSVGAMTSYTFTNVTSDHTIDASFIADTNNTVDNLDAGFTTVGAWGSSTYSPGYYGSNYEWAPPGDGSMTATWTFDIASQGQYNVFAQWTSNPNRASNAPYTIYINDQLVETISADQTVNGGQFNLLGSYLLVPGTLKVVLNNNASGYVIADAVQIGLIGSGTPSFKIASPKSLDLKTSPDITVSASAIGFPSDWNVNFVIDGDSANPMVGDANICPTLTYGLRCLDLTGLSMSEHTLDAYLVDGGGVTQSYSDHVNFGVGVYYVAFGDSITHGVEGDNITTDNTSADLRNTGGGYEPILNDLLTSATGYPHTVVNEGIDGEDSSAGLARVQNVIDANPDAQYFLILFGTNDSFSTSLYPDGRPSGLGLSPGDPGYANSYKDNMQQIINAILAAGKTPILARVGITLGPCHNCTPFPDPDTAPRNLLIQDYNQVLANLANGTTVLLGPDFYALFDGYVTSTTRLYDYDYFDNYHPNGTGYQDMATAWFNSLTSLLTYP